MSRLGVYGSAVSGRSFVWARSGLAASREIAKSRLMAGKSIISVSRKGDTMADLSTTFTGISFENPFLLASAPPTESDSNIMRAFEAGWGGVVTKTIGLHPVVNVKGPKTKFLRATP